MYLICYPGTTILMIDRILTWIVTRKFEMLFLFFFIVKKWTLALSLDLSLSFPFQGLLKICSERALKGREGEQMIIKPPQKSLIDKNMVLRMSFFPSLCAYSANVEGIYCWKVV